MARTVYVFVTKADLTMFMSDVYGTVEDVILNCVQFRDFRFSLKERTLAPNLTFHLREMFSVFCRAARQQKLLLYKSYTAVIVVHRTLLSVYVFSIILRNKPYL